MPQTGTATPICSALTTIFRWQPSYTPLEAVFEHYMALLARLDLSHGVLVQPSKLVNLICKHLVAAIYAEKSFGDKHSS